MPDRKNPEYLRRLASDRQDDFMSPVLLDCADEIEMGRNRRKTLYSLLGDNEVTIYNLTNELALRKAQLEKLFEL